jgi:hypothetical protein
MVTPKTALSVLALAGLLGGLSAQPAAAELGTLLKGKADCPHCLVQGKDGCNASDDGEDKDSCSGKDGCDGEDKESCGGKDGCGAKE